MTAVERRIGLDVLKGAAMVLVVFNHALLWPMRSGDRPSAFLYGVAFGTVAAFAGSAGFVRGLRPPVSDRALLARRAGQLLLPWALAAPLYAAAPFVWRAFGGGALPMGFDPVPWAREIMLGGGPLWFFPVLFVSQAVCTPFIRRTRSWWPAVAALAVFAVTAVLASRANVSPIELGRGTFWAVSPLYVAAFWFGLRQAQDDRPRISRPLGIALVVATMLASGAITLIRIIDPDLRWLMWLPYAIGLVGGCTALMLAEQPLQPAPAEPTRLQMLQLRARDALALIGRSSLGIYVAHPAIVGPLVLLARGRWGALGAAVIAIVTIGLATPLVRMAARLARSGPRVSEG